LFVYSALTMTVESSQIADIIEVLSCPVHKIRPIAAVQKNLIKLTCCCDDFKHKCSFIINKLKEGYKLDTAMHGRKDRKIKSH
jgi:hypothetical protein